MKKIKKLKLEKSAISRLNTEEQKNIQGGGDTSYLGTCGCSQGSFIVACGSCTYHCPPQKKQ